jgi:hypothetical protein
MATRKIKSVKGRVMRLTRLDECGNPYAGECATIVTDGFISVTLSDEVEAGEEYTQKNAWGDFCIAEKDADRRKWVNVAIQMCEVDPEVLDLVGGATPVEDGQGNIIGATFGRDPNPNSFAIEVWTKKAGSSACDPGSGAAEWGYFAVPNVTNGSIDGDVTIENGPLTMGLKGEGQGAAEGWGDGPYDPPALPAGATFPPDDLYGIFITTTAPPDVTDGCQPLAAAPAATGATAGSPGTWTPSGSTAPANAAAATSVTASPASAWTTGQYVQGSDAGVAGEMYWSGSAWTSGRAT